MYATPDKERAATQGGWVVPLCCSTAVVYMAAQLEMLSCGLIGDRDRDRDRDGDSSNMKCQKLL